MSYFFIIIVIVFLTMTIVSAITREISYRRGWLEHKNVKLLMWPHNWPDKKKRPAKLFFGILIALSLIVPVLFCLAMLMAA